MQFATFPHVSCRSPLFALMLLAVSLDFSSVWLPIVAQVWTQTTGRIWGFEPCWLCWQLLYLFIFFVVLVWASLVRRWGALWLLTSSPHSPPCSSPSSLLSLPLGVTDADGPAGSSHSSHIKVLLSTSANGAYNVKQSARWGGEKVPLRSPQHCSHNAPPSSSPTPLNNTPSSVHRPLN